MLSDRRPARKKAWKTHAFPPFEAFSNSRREIPCPVPHASHEKHHFRLGYEKSGVNTHAPASFYEAFEPAEARRIAKRLEIHYTPKHGSWLNRAEMEISAMVGQCLNRRLPDRETLRREVDAWQERRNPRSRARGLAIHDRRRTDQTEITLPINIKVIAY